MVTHSQIVHKSVYVYLKAFSTIVTISRHNIKADRALILFFIYIIPFSKMKAGLFQAVMDMREEMNWLLMDEIAFAISKTNSLSKQDCKCCYYSSFPQESVDI